MKSRLSGVARISFQIALIFVIWMIAYALKNRLNLPIASGILGFFLLLMLLQTKCLKLETVEQGANVLLAELLIFFIPPVVGVIQYQELLISNGLKILIVIVLSTAMVMATSVWVVKIFLNQHEEGG